MYKVFESTKLSLCKNRCIGNCSTIKDRQCCAMKFFYKVIYVCLNMYVANVCLHVRTSYICMCAYACSSQRVCM